MIVRSKTKGSFSGNIPAFGYISSFHFEDTASIGAKFKQLVFKFERKICNIKIILYLQNLRNEK